MSKIAYVRVSTQEQNEARQREALAARGIDKWFIEKTSAKDTDRPEFQRMMDWVREGDTIYIHDLSRIARSTLDLLHLLNVIGQPGDQGSCAVFVDVLKRKILYLVKQILP